MEEPPIQLNQELYTFLTADFDSTNFLAFEPDSYLRSSISDEISGPEMFIREFGIPVQIGNDLEIDSVWLCANDYYSVWDSKKVNPYDLDGEKFADTLQVELFNEKMICSGACQLRILIKHPHLA